MNIKDQIRAKIERMLEFDKDVKTNYYIGRRDAEMEILAIFDTIPEQPVEGLEEAADAHIRRVADASRDWTTQDIAEAFIAGAKWGAEHLKR